jgi:hypothetical protein
VLFCGLIASCCAAVHLEIARIAAASIDEAIALLVETNSMCSDSVRQHEVAGDDLHLELKSPQIHVVPHLQFQPHNRAVHPGIFRGVLKHEQYYGSIWAVIRGDAPVDLNLTLLMLRNGTWKVESTKPSRAEARFSYMRYRNAYLGRLEVWLSFVFR